MKPKVDYWGRPEKDEDAKPAPTHDYHGRPAEAVRLSDLVPQNVKGSEPEKPDWSIPYLEDPLYRSSSIRTINHTQCRIFVGDSEVGGIVGADLAVPGSERTVVSGGARWGKSAEAQELAATVRAMSAEVDAMFMEAKPPEHVSHLCAAGDRMDDYALGKCDGPWITTDGPLGEVLAAAAERAQRALAAARAVPKIACSSTLYPWSTNTGDGTDPPATAKASSCSSGGCSGKCTPSAPTCRGECSECGLQAACEGDPVRQPAEEKELACTCESPWAPDSVNCAYHRKIADAKAARRKKQYGR